MKYMIFLSMVSFSISIGNDKLANHSSIPNIALRLFSISVFAFKCYECGGDEECVGLDNTKVLECPRPGDGCIWHFEDCMLFSKKKWVSKY